MPAIDLICEPASFGASIYQVRSGFQRIAWLLQSELGVVAVYGAENIPLGWTFSSRQAALVEVSRLWHAVQMARVKDELA